MGIARIDQVKDQDHQNAKLETERWSNFFAWFGRSTWEGLREWSWDIKCDLGTPSLPLPGYKYPHCFPLLSLSHLQVLSSTFNFELASSFHSELASNSSKFQLHSFSSNLLHLFHVPRFTFNFHYASMHACNHISNQSIMSILLTHWSHTPINTHSQLALTSSGYVYNHHPPCFADL